MDPQQLAQLEQLFLEKQEAELARKQQAQAPNPLIFDKILESQALNTPGAKPLNPMVSAVMKRLGLTSLVRNRANAGVVAGDASVEQ